MCDSCTTIFPLCRETWLMQQSLYAVTRLRIAATMSYVELTRGTILARMSLRCAPPARLRIMVMEGSAYTLLRALRCLVGTCHGKPMARNVAPSVCHRLIAIQHRSKPNTRQWVHHGNAFVMVRDAISRSLKDSDHAQFGYAFLPALSRKLSAKR